MGENGRLWEHNNWIILHWADFYNTQQVKQFISLQGLICGGLIVIRIVDEKKISGETKCGVEFRYSVFPGICGIKREAKTKLILQN